MAAALWTQVFGGTGDVVALRIGKNIRDAEVFIKVALKAVHVYP